MVDLVSWNPYREFQTLAERFNRAFSGTPVRRDEEMSLGAWLPPVDISEE